MGELMYSGKVDKVSISNSLSGNSFSHKSIKNKRNQIIPLMEEKEIADRSLYTSQKGKKAKKNSQIKEE